MSEVSVKDLRKFVWKRINRLGLGSPQVTKNRDRSNHAKLQAYQDILRLCNQVESSGGNIDVESIETDTLFY